MMQINKHLGSLLIIVVITLLQLAQVHAAPQVVVTDPKTGQPLTQQPAVASLVASSVTPTQNPNQPSLAQLNKPTDSQLSQANTQLLAKNAELQNQVDSLNTQVNVLVNERSGQLFIYGAFTALLSGILGIALGWLVFGRNKGRW